eukprot:TRINITY_DN101837_c0_g1_i1.p1 TRINITY_DN101837_c0_g1~~TRINITY_DN101837_c0_g1_i1.p1  ORF type:complete len:395 (-),score=48.00 TRINITY_DN101837_c0_g1_i1:58-1242(-)
MLRRPSLACALSRMRSKAAIPASLMVLCSAWLTPPEQVAVDSAGGVSRTGPSQAPHWRPKVFGKDGKLRLIQVTDLHIMDIDRAFGGSDVPRAWRSSMGDSQECLRRTIDLVTRTVKQEEVHLAVLTGDIVDARDVKTVDAFLAGMRPLTEALDGLGIPWAYIPGNHEDGHGEEYARNDLTKLFSLPGSLASPGSFDTFDQTFLLPIAGGSADDVAASVLLQLVDAKWTSKTCYITDGQVAVSRRNCHSLLNSQTKGKEELPLAKLAFAHEPFDEFQDTAIPMVSGTRTHSPRQNMSDSGYVEFLKEEGFHAVFVGHNHHNDFVRWSSEKGDPWYGHGRCGSYFPPSSWEDRLPLPFGRGARIFEVDAVQKSLSTWVVEDGVGALEPSRISRPL